MNPYSDLGAFRKHQERFEKIPWADNSEELTNLIKIHLNFAEATGHPISPPAKVLDVGCGLGDSVRILDKLGYAASGVDVFEWWDKDFDLYWLDGEKPQGAHLANLHRIDSKNYRFPFPDAYFDFAFSDQVFEHVFNLEAVFKEIARVLKPGAISVHKFPARNFPFEGHVFVPFPVLCYYKPYLALWALLGVRAPNQRKTGWRETLEQNIASMKYVSYVTKSKLRAVARSAGVKIEFMEKEEMRLRPSGMGRITRIRDFLPKPLRPIWLRILGLFYLQYLVIHGRGSTKDLSSQKNRTPF